MLSISLLEINIQQLCIAVKILKDFIFSTKQRPSLMVCLFSHSVQRITFLTTFFIMVQGYPQKNSRSSGGWCSLGSALGFRSVFSFSGNPVKKDIPSPQAGNNHRNPCQGPRVLPVRICLDLTLSNGLHILQKDLDYPGLYRLIQKLEVLC